jgi:hypothetical protein
MPTLPSGPFLLRVFATTEHFGVVADTPFGCGYRLQGLEVAVSFFGHHVYFVSGDAVLVLTESGTTTLARPDAADNRYLLDLISRIGLQYQL